MTTDWLIVIVSAGVWWVPTFYAMTDLQQRDGLPRGAQWKWGAVIAVPVIGAAAYARWGRPELDAFRR